MRCWWPSTGDPPRSCETCSRSRYGRDCCPTPGPERLAFSHELVREALYTGLDDKEARRQHAEVVAAIEQTPHLARGAALAELAHHAFRAYPEIAHDRALDHVLAAAREAGCRLAFDEAIGHYALALDREAAAGCPAFAVEAPHARAEVALELAQTRQHAGDLAGARRTYLDVVATARELDDPSLLAQAALGIHQLGSSEADWTGDLDLLEEARGRLDRAGGEATDQLAVRLMSAVSRDRHSWDAEAGDSHDLAARVLELAREGGDDDALGFALLARPPAGVRGA